MNVAPAQRVRALFDESIRTAGISRDTLADDIARAAAVLVDTLEETGKVLACGNGGSAADAQHFAAELLNRFEIERRPLPALALNTDTSTLTSIANDYDFDRVFSKQVEALGTARDTLVAITTSGTSPNVVAALEVAKRLGMRCILLNGKDGRPAADALGPDDVEIRVPSHSTARIQEIHGIVIHCLCTLIDTSMFGDSK